MGRTDEQGRFELTTFEAGDGAVAGEHVVTVSKSAAANQPAPSGPEDMMQRYTERMIDNGSAGSDSGVESLLPAQFASPQSSPIRRTVTEGSNDFTIELGEYTN